MINNIAILGLGAIGSIIAKEILSLTNFHIDLYNRTPRSHLHVTSGNSLYKRSIEIGDIPKEDKEYDLLILCLKEHDIPKAIQYWSSLISKKSTILVIRNGIHHTEQLKSIGVSNKIIPAIIDCPTQQTNYGYQQMGNAIITIPKSEDHNIVESIFKSTKVHVIQSNTFHHDTWLKLCLSASLGATQCKYNGTCEIFVSDEVVMYFFELLMESISIANADRANISKSEIKSILLKVEQYPPEKGSSMLFDFQSGKPIELGAKNGAILSAAQRLKRPASRNKEFVNWLTLNRSKSHRQ